MDQGEGEADGQPGESLGRPVIGGSQDDEQEHPSQDDLGGDYRAQRVAAGGMLAESVGRQVARRGKAFLTLGDDVDREAGEQAADHLHNPVARHRFPLDPSRQRRAQGDGGIEVAAGDGSECVDAGEHGQAEGECHAEKADPQRGTVGGGELRGENRAAAAAEDQPECADQLRCQSMKHSWSRHALPPSPLKWCPYWCPKLCPPKRRTSRPGPGRHISVTIYARRNTVTSFSVPDGRVAKEAAWPMRMTLK